MEAPLVFFAILLIGSALSRSISADLMEDKRALLDFVRNLSRGRDLDLGWKENLSVCKNWSGVTCSPDLSRVVAVQVSGYRLDGQMTPNTLSRLSALRLLYLRSNGLTGPLPLDFSVWKNLTVLDLSFNSFNGSIPTSISNLTQLTVLNLANNSLSGEIPDFELPKLRNLSLANNLLSGNVPTSLKRFPNSSFAGNNLSLLVSPHLTSFSPGYAPVSNPRKRRKIRESVVLGIIAGFCAAAVAAFGVFLVVHCLRRKDQNGASGKFSKGERSPEKATMGSQDENNGLVFFEGCSYAFDLEDLLRASAEVLGKGTFGTAYKAVLEDATMVVVKRLKEVSVGKKDFEQQMEVVGRIRHENLVGLRAYYYSKDEKLMVYDYYCQGSVSSMLHAKRGQEMTPLDWDTRLRIAIGTARAVAHIHSENCGKLVHGNIKSSNIFLNADSYGCVSDLGLSTLMNPTTPPFSRAAGYRAPELIDTRKASQASDVYSVGVVLLELLTGKSAIHTSGGEEVVHLVRWVQSVVREEWTAEVFDIELLRYPDIEEELVEMLQIAMKCVQRMPEQRPKMEDVLKRMEDIRPVHTGNRSSSESKSDDSNCPTPSFEVGESSLQQ
ncbi:Protein kinase domain-containing protein [Cinnamomum micranthum f. kanehirae]|uniref:Protein kinase domain-containing protein n=1 Tax=Cinnamomum micranthum f. kanehirae TaxID=337451 RepID=A0A3S3QZT4_9MAGN|nr:Protein kinase domain-containing protein [Cinnamomum micranthum f. kanehirae]